MEVLTLYKQNLNDMENQQPSIYEPKVEEEPRQLIVHRPGLSGKQWDVSIKALTKNGLLKVTKTEDQLTVDLV